MRCPFCGNEANHLMGEAWRYPHGPTERQVSWIWCPDRRLWYLQVHAEKLRRRLRIWSTGG